MSLTTSPNKVGVIGGMGPLASAEFLKTIYSYHIGGKEQEAPIVIMRSDPTYPDRTEAILTSNTDRLRAKLRDEMDRLITDSVATIIVCCVTMHHVFERLPSFYRKYLVSLVDVVIDYLVMRKTQHLMLCTNGTRKMNVFQRHPGWVAVVDYVTMPDEADQMEIHQMLYQIKQGCDVRRYVTKIAKLMDKYMTEAYVAGCTELHLLNRTCRHQDSVIYDRCLDPLEIVANTIIKERHSGISEYSELVRTGS